MDSFNLIKIDNKKESSVIQNIKGNISIKFFKILLISLFILNVYIIFIIFYSKNDLNKKINKLSNIFINNSNQIINKKILNNKDKFIYDEIFNLSIKQQNDFCQNPNKYFNPQYEELIKLAKFSLRGLSYQMYVYSKYDDRMSGWIIKTGKYEPKQMSYILDALKFYGKIKNIVNNKDIFILDIGGNIGQYTTFLGKHGYSILTFEASPRNYYILNKNYCLNNKNSNIILINKGISNQEKICNYFTHIESIGNGILLCDEKKKNFRVKEYHFTKTFEVSLTKLSNFIPFLSSKNLALIKIDIEGAEGKVIEEGIELINKFHIPYIFSEYNTKLLKKHGTDPKKYLQYFTTNGYKISLKGFLSKSYVTIDEIKTELCDLYFIYNGN